MEVTDVQYKESEIGVIPVDWNVKKISDFSKPVRGGSPRPAGSPLYFNGDYIPWLTVAALTNISSSQIFVSETEGFLTQLGSEYSRTLEKDTLIIANSGATLGVAKLLAIKCCANDGIAALNNFSREVDKAYVVYYINSITQKLREVVATGNGQPNLNTTLIGDLRIPLPPTKSEQTAIATALSDTDALIENLEKLIAKKRNIKQCIMHNLLMPRDYWETRKVKEIVSSPVTDGPHETPKFLKEGVPFLSVNNLVNNRIDFNELRFISQEDHQLYSRKCKPQKNDILLGKAASVGKVAILNTDLEINIWSPIALIRPKNTFMPYFIYYFFQTSRILKQIEFFTNSSSQGNIGMGDIEKIEISYPPFDEQVQIAQVLTDIDSELNALDQKLQKYTRIKQGMMQALLTGKIRLV